MPTKTWKSVERAISKFFPGSIRRGADFRGEDTAGKSDLVYPGWSIEIKHTKTPYFSLIIGAVNQAEINRTKPEDIPVAIIHKEGTPYKDSLVVMRLSEFVNFFVNEVNE